jgi:hypothetical protein
MVGRSAGLSPRCLRFYPAAQFAREFIKKLAKHACAWQRENNLLHYLWHEQR